MIRSLLLLGLILVSTVTTIASAQEKFPPKENFDLFLLVGQSNMAGRGKVTEADRVPAEGVLMFNADQQWVPAVDPLHFDKPKIAGVGLGRTFGIEVAKASPGKTIGLIPCAVGGTGIDVWIPGARDAATNTHPWDDAMVRAKAALKDGTLRGILWHQGESDSNPEKAAAYEAKLHDLIARFRAELDAPDVPFIVGQLGIFPGKPWDDAKHVVDKAHQDLPSKVKATAFVSADGLVDGGDKTHFDAESMREFGRRYAAAYQKWIVEPDAK
jgi:hypothetical protein